MKLNKAEKRDRRRQKARHGMRVNGKSVFVIQAELIKRARRKEEQ